MIPKTIQYYDLFEILDMMEKEGYMSRRKVLDEKYIEIKSNDCIQYLCLWNERFIELEEWVYDWMTYDDYVEWHEYCETLKRKLNLPEDASGIYVEVCW